MKTIAEFWARRSSYEKMVIGLTLGAVMFSLGYFSGILPRFFCPICRQDLAPGQDYIWDIRTGDLLPISDYLDGQQDRVWIGGSGHIPQEVSVSQRCGYVRFPKDVEDQASYCPSHRTGLGGLYDFAVVSVGEGYTVCYGIGGGDVLAPAGQIISQRFNSGMDCWELAIQWTG